MHCWSVFSRLSWCRGRPYLWRIQGFVGRVTGSTRLPPSLTFILSYARIVLRFAFKVSKITGAEDTDSSPGENHSLAMPTFCGTRGYALKTTDGEVFSTAMATTKRNKSQEANAYRQTHLLHTYESESHYLSVHACMFDSNNTFSLSEKLIPFVIEIQVSLLTS